MGVWDNPPMPSLAQERGWVMTHIRQMRGDGATHAPFISVSGICVGGAIYLHPLRVGEWPPTNL